MCDDLENQPKNTDIEAGQFFLKDFSEAIANSRHYDKQIIDIFRFTLVAYIAFIGAVFGLLKYGGEVERTIRAIAPEMLIGCSFVGVMMFFILIRNRVYFVVSVRYVNSIRRCYFDIRPTFLSAVNKFFLNDNLPRFYHASSSHMLFSHILSILNGFVLGLAIYIADKPPSVIFVASVAITGIQITSGIVYLTSMEGKGRTDLVVFGKTEQR